MSIILCGFKNCGKTSIGKTLAELLDYQFVDTDHLISKQYYIHYGMEKEIPEIHRSLGETQFRQLESDSVFSLSKNNERVIATGGGSLLKQENVQHLKKMGKIIYLKTDIAEIKRRMLEQDQLPSFIDNKNINEDFKRYIEKRESTYETVADSIVEVGDRSIVTIAAEIMVHHVLHERAQNLDSNT